MAIPNLPTDNLYKFEALFGLFLIVYSFVSLHWWSNTAWDKIIKIQKEMNHYDSQKTLLEVSQAELSKEISRYEQLIENNGVSEEALEKLSVATRNLDKVNSQKHVLMADSAIDAEIRKMEFDADSQKYIILFALVIGGLLAFDGLQGGTINFKNFKIKFLRIRLEGGKKGHDLILLITSGLSFFGFFAASPTRHSSISSAG